ncbi:unnamed protein product [Amoebophrya sp. A120]|nr:unnamed protein product [Amoebophrya sp. A120]|eukprot:GSA120T00025054001.1
MSSTSKRPRGHQGGVTIGGKTYLDEDDDSDFVPDDEDVENEERERKRLFKEGQRKPSSAKEKDGAQKTSSGTSKFPPTTTDAQRVASTDGTDNERRNKQRDHAGMKEAELRGVARTATSTAKSVENRLQLQAAQIFEEMMAEAEAERVKERTRKELPAAAGPCDFENGERTQTVTSTTTCGSRDWNWCERATPHEAKIVQLPGGFRTSGLVFSAAPAGGRSRGLLVPGGGGRALSSSSKRPAPSRGWLGEDFVGMKAAAPSRSRTTALDLAALLGGEVVRQHPDVAPSREGVVAKQMNNKGLLATASAEVHLHSTSKKKTIPARQRFKHDQKLNVRKIREDVAFAYRNHYHRAADRDAVKAFASTVDTVSTSAAQQDAREAGRRTGDNPLSQGPAGNDRTTGGGTHNGGTTGTGAAVLHENFYTDLFAQLEMDDPVAGRSRDYASSDVSTSQAVAQLRSLVRDSEDAASVNLVARTCGAQFLLWVARILGSEVDGMSFKDVVGPASSASGLRAELERGVGQTNAELLRRLVAERVLEVYQNGGVVAGVSSAAAMLTTGALEAASAPFDKARVVFAADPPALGAHVLDLHAGTERKTTRPSSSKRNRKAKLARNVDEEDLLTKQADNWELSAAPAFQALVRIVEADRAVGEWQLATIISQSEQDWQRFLEQQKRSGNDELDVGKRSGLMYLEEQNFLKKTEARGARK